METKNPIVAVKVLWEDMAHAIPGSRCNCVWNLALRRTLKLGSKNAPRMDARGFGYTELETGERVKLGEPQEWVLASVRLFDELGKELPLEEARLAVSK
jgi:hypothetical protein